MRRVTSQLAIAVSVLGFMGIFSELRALVHVQWFLESFSGFSLSLFSMIILDAPCTIAQDLARRRHPLVPRVDSGVLSSILIVCSQAFNLWPEETHV